jgi:pimeloyl-ACP methyl ester carboxylesterase
MKRILKILLWIFSVLITLLIIVSIIFVRFDISQEKLEEEYFLDQSHYIDLTIQDLDNQAMDIQIHYQDMGDQANEVVFLIHGTFASSHTFIPWAETLVEEDYRVIMIDLPYFGLSDGFKDHITSYRRHAEVVKALIDALDISQVHIAGNSLGGAVAWFFTSEYPDAVTTLTLIDAVYPDGDRQDNTLFSSLSQLGFLSDWLSLYTPKFLMERILSSAYGDPNHITDETLTRYYELLRKSGTRQSILKLTEEPEPDLSYIDRLKSINVPTYLMWGAKDSWIPVETVDLFQDTMNIPESNIFIYQDLGHVPMEENPSLTVLDYLSIIS